jgi:hypothetical protein
VPGPIARGLVGFAVVCGALWLGVWRWARMPSHAPLDEAQRKAAMAILRDGLDRKPVGAQLPPLDDVAVAQLFLDGKPVQRAEARDFVALANALRRSTLDDAARARARIKLDLVRGRAPMLSWPDPLFALSMVPGLDGVGVRYGDREALLLPDDLTRADLLAGQHPLPQLELEIGLDTDGLVALAKERLGGDVDAGQLRWFRFRCESYVEPASHLHGGAPLPVVRGNTPGPALGKQALVDGAHAGGRYLIAHLAPDGRFEYEYDVVGDKHHGSPDDYSIPRHAGAVYFLSQLYAATKDPAVVDAAERALWFLAERSKGGCDRGPRACVGEPGAGLVDLGSSAMALLAAAEFRKATGKSDFDAWANRLAAFLLYMQVPSGDFRHLYRTFDDQRDEVTKLPYYSGEATLALAKWSTQSAPPPALKAKWIDAADRGLDYLTDGAYDYFAGQFFFGEDHWTCMAADAMWDALPDAHRRRYARFCDRFAEFLRRMQFEPGDPVVAEQPDFLGAYGLSPILPPHATPVGSRSETTISIWRMQRRLGSPDAETTRKQVLLGMQFLLSRQITDDAAYLMPNPDEARGGLTMSDVKRYIRIDFIQHSCSAMLRAVELL